MSSSSPYFPDLGEDQIRVSDGPSPSNTLSLDDFSRDPGFLASQEELRSLILNTAQSTLPSRESSPLRGGVGGRDLTAAQVQRVKQILSEGRNLEYLRNYSSQVAPWVSHLFPIFHYCIPCSPFSKDMNKSSSMHCCQYLIIASAARHVRQYPRLWHSTPDVCAKRAGSALRSSCSISTPHRAKTRNQKLLRQFGAISAHHQIIDTNDANSRPAESTHLCHTLLPRDDVCKSTRLATTPRRLCGTV